MTFGASRKTNDNGNTDDTVAYNILFQGPCDRCNINVMMVITVFQRSGHHGHATTGLSCPKCGNIVPAVGQY